MTQESLADKTGISTNFVSEVERGLKAPGLVVIAKFSEALDVSVSELVRDLTPEKLVRTSRAKRR